MVKESSMKTMRELTVSISSWAQANFGNTPVQNLKITDNTVEWNWFAPLLGMGEEIGELAKQVKNNGNEWIDLHETVDAIADIGIYFCDYLGRRCVKYDFTKRYTPVPKQFVPMLATAYGDILHCELKHAQKIRGMGEVPAFLAAHEQACGKFYESLCMGCERIVGMELEDVINDVFTRTVSKRDWKKNKATG